MTANLSNANGKTTLSLNYTAANEVMQPVLESIAQGLYEEGQVWWTGNEPPPPYEQLTTAQKLGLINAYIKHSLLEVHITRMVAEATASAAEEAEAAAAVEIDQG